MAWRYLGTSAGWPGTGTCGATAVQLLSFSGRRRGLYFETSHMRKRCLYMRTLKASQQTGLKSKVAAVSAYVALKPCCDSISYLTSLSVRWSPRYSFIICSLMSSQDLLLGTADRPTVAMVMAAKLASGKGRRAGDRE